MDAGTAAILGAAVGGLFGAGGTLGAAFLTGRFQGRSQHGQWWREGRRAAYSNFIAAVTSFREAADALEMADDQGRDEIELSELLKTVHDRWPAVRSTAPVVAVEGPQKVADLAAKIERHVEGFAIHSDLDAEERAHGQSDGGRTFLCEAHNALVDISRDLHAFAVGARETLDRADTTGQ
ncbi:hypothetical protein DY245_24265 [Streptomyces inhibens]|uniref:Proline dehydrogenase n=1 Tax=Streptomyces inhibens TaxID=2293571 RepID=A0A371PZI6_STRIH|nr:hypothetical protein [Streptomyces inhibens]REK87897.1 hypothetical protein DY245_24265 [Streptomyces inhibens]